MNTAKKVKRMFYKAASAKRLNSKIMQKRAELANKPSEAYIAGFCKVAEDAGIDPTELVKFAASFKDLGNAFVSPFKGLWDGAKAVGQGIWNGGKQMLQGNFSNGLQTMSNGLEQGAVNVGRGYLDGLKSTVKGLTPESWHNGIRNSVNTAANGLMSANNTLNSWGNSLKNSITNKVKGWLPQSWTGGGGAPAGAQPSALGGARMGVSRGSMFAKKLMPGPQAAPGPVGGPAPQAAPGPQPMMGQ